MTSTIPPTTVIALITSLSGTAWIVIRLYFGVRRLRREEMVEEAEAHLRAAKATEEAARILSSLKKKFGEKP